MQGKNLALLILGVVAAGVSILAINGRSTEEKQPMAPSVLIDDTTTSDGEVISDEAVISIDDIHLEDFMNLELRGSGFRPAIGDDTVADEKKSNPAVVAGEVPAFALKGLDWLAKAQKDNGAWGAGSHANQGVRDPHAVTADPGTTAFTAMAFLRAGHELDQGQHSEVVAKATSFLLDLVDEAPADGPKITDVTGTQPQAKLGQLIDTSLVSQFMARLLSTLDDDHSMRPRVTAALEKCVAKIGSSQKDDGSWNHGGWAPVLQSSMFNSAIEMAAAAEVEIDEDILKKSRDYQKSNFDGSSSSFSGAKGGAGVALYAASSGQRASAAQARQAQDAVDAAQADGRLMVGAAVDAPSLSAAGFDAEEARELAESFAQNAAAALQLSDESTLAGFGNNGGEEFLSYMQSSESLVITGGEAWTNWNEKIHARLAKIQNADGSWSGHHCITSPVFCTAAAVQCLTADRDADMLAQAAGVDRATASR